MIASLRQAVIDLQTDFDDEIARPADIPVAWPNAPFDVTTQTGLWADFHILTSASDEQLDIGAAVKEYRMFGVLAVNLYSPAQTGEEAALRAAASITTRYRCVELAGCTFATPTVEPGTLSGPWWRTSVRCPFEALYAA